MKKVILTVGGILLALAIVAGIYLSTFKNAAENLAEDAVDEITTKITFTP